MKNIFIILFTVLSINVYANGTDSLWTKGNDAYSLGEWESALTDYTAIEKAGFQSYNLYYNIANTYYKIGNYGKAILYYERALKINPSGKDAKNNLEIAKLHSLDKIEVLPQFILVTWIKNLRNTMSSNSWAYIAIALFAITALLMLFYRYAPTTFQRKFSFVLACFTMLVFIFSVSFAVNLRLKANSSDNAIIIAPVGNIKSAPNATGNNLFILHEGTKVLILEQAGQWSRIEISDGRQGWMLNKDMEVI